MAANPQTQSCVRFGPFELDLATAELRKNGVRLKLSGQAIRVLTILVSSPGEMVTRDALKQALWPGTNFGDLEHGLNAAVNRLREVLGDSASDPVYVETIPGRGYRFIPQESEPNDKIRVLPVVPARRSFGPKFALLIGAVVAIAALLFFLRLPVERMWRVYQLQKLSTSRITSLPGSVYSPSFSPDKSQIAFAWNGESDGAGFDLYVKVFGSDVPRRLTKHPAKRLSTAWAPDGRNIAFSRVATDGSSGIYLVSAGGGPERKIADRSDRTWYGSEVSWSPDGKQLAMIDRPPSNVSDNVLRLYLLSLDTLQKTSIDEGCVSSATPSFSPGGRYLAWVCNRAMYQSAIHLMRVSDQKVSELFLSDSCILGIAWSPDERRLVFSTMSDAGALREVEIAEPGHVENLSLGQNAMDLAASPKGDGVAYVKESYNVNIWRLDLNTNEPKARRVIVSSQTDKSPSISPDGKKIAFESTRSGNTEVWMADADGANAQQLTSFGLTMTGTPRWSPDGKTLAFDSRRDGEANLYVIQANGGVAHKLPLDVRGNSQPSWSHDGKYLYFVNGEDAGTPAIFKVPVKGGHAVPISSVGGTYPQESADGSRVLFSKNNRLFSVRPDGAEERMVEGMNDSACANDEWFPVAAGIYFMTHQDRKNVLRFFEYQSKSTKDVFVTEKSTPPWIGSMPVSPDGKYLLFPQEDHSSSDLMMIENWR